MHCNYLQQPSFMGGGGVVYHLRSPSSNVGQIVKRGFSENEVAGCWSYNSYKICIFWQNIGWILSGFLFLVCLFCFLCLALGVFFVKRVWSVHRQLGFEPIFRQGGSNHKLTSQRKSPFDWFSEKAGAGDIVFTLFKSEQLSWTGHLLCLLGWKAWFDLQYFSSSVESSCLCSYHCLTANCPFSICESCCY